MLPSVYRALHSLALFYLSNLLTLHTHQDHSGPLTKPSWSSLRLSRSLKVNMLFLLRVSSFGTNYPTTSDHSNHSFRPSFFLWLLGIPEWIYLHKWFFFFLFLFCWSVGLYRPFYCLFIFLCSAEMVFCRKLCLTVVSVKHFGQLVLFLNVLHKLKFGLTICYYLLGGLEKIHCCEWSDCTSSHWAWWNDVQHGKFLHH